MIICEVDSLKNIFSLKNMFREATPEIKRNKNVASGCHNTYLQESVTGIYISASQLITINDNYYGKRNNHF